MRLHTGMPESMNYEVYLDGKLLENCTEASDESGIAFVLDTDPDGRLQKDHQRDCTREEFTVTMTESLMPGHSMPAGVGKIIFGCDCPFKTKMLRGRVEFRRRMRTRHIWVSPSKE